MKKNLIKISIVLSIFLGGVSLVSAASSVVEFVPCGGAGQEMCEGKHIFLMISKILDFVLKTLIPLIVVFMVARAGYKLVVSGDKAGALVEVKKSIWSIAKGIFFMLAAWLIVKTMIGLLGVNFGTGEDSASNGVINLLGQ
jgi:uncharacterized membrane protein (GlpM family)